MLTIGATRWEMVDLFLLLSSMPGETLMKTSDELQNKSDSVSRLAVNVLITEHIVKNGTKPLETTENAYWTIVDYEGV